jgi:hypothetical protein
MSFDHSRTLARWRSEKKRKRATDLHEVGDYLISSYESTSPDLAGAIAGLFLKAKAWSWQSRSQRDPRKAAMQVLALTWLWRGLLGI